jgi:branched-chain amino acid transport system ATP-binding protein
MSLLEVDGLSVRYGEVTAVDSVGFDLDRGEVLGIIGPNGAGKTSLIDALSGFVPAATGSIKLDGRDVTTTAPHIRANHGLVRTWQSGELFDDLTVRENLLVAADSPSWPRMAADVFRAGRRVAGEEWVEELLGALGLESVAERLVSSIPHDKRKLVSIARALASRPQVVTLDEPAAGLTPEETVDLGTQLRRIAAGGVAMVLIEHDMGLVRSVCDRLLVIDFGKPIAAGLPADVIADPRVVAAYMGARASEEVSG